MMSQTIDQARDGRLALWEATLMKKELAASSQVSSVNALKQNQPKRMTMNIKGAPISACEVEKPRLRLLVKERGRRMTIKARIASTSVTRKKICIRRKFIELLKF